MRYVALIVFLVCTQSLNAAEKLSLESKDGGIEIRGATGSVAWIGVANEPVRGNTQIVVRHMFVQPNATSAPQIKLANGVAPRSLWAAVDTVTGDIATAVSKLFKLKPKQAADIVGEAVAEPATLRIKAEWVELLLVRPGEGAWRYTAGDGGQSDEDGSLDGFITVRFSRGEPFGEPPLRPAPAFLRPKDVVILIDVPAMTIYSVKR